VTITAYYTPTQTYTRKFEVIRNEKSDNLKEQIRNTEFLNEADIEVN
jgi:hypothetical protein